MTITFVLPKQGHKNEKRAITSSHRAAALRHSWNFYKNHKKGNLSPIRLAPQASTVTKIAAAVQRQRSQQKLVGDASGRRSNEPVVSSFSCIRKHVLI